MDDGSISESARHLSRRAGGSGGRARAERLTAEQRSEIATRAAQARWGKQILSATHTGKICIGNQEIACAVLEDGTRIINQSVLLTTLSRNRRARHNAAGPPVLSAANLQPYVSVKLASDLRNPIMYTPPNGGRALGYPAHVLTELCEVYLAARADGRLLRQQLDAVEAAEILVRGLARVGIVALIDEATGYQEVRARQELQRILEAYVQAELRQWLKTFPDEFFQQIYRLQGWEFKPGTSKRTPQVGKLVNRYVYDALPPGVHDELRRLNPRTERGYRQYKHHQFLTADTGHPHLDKHISIVMTLMRVAGTKREFEDLFQRAFPPLQQRLPLILEAEDPE